MVKDYSIAKGKVTFTETISKVLSVSDIEQDLQSISREKARMIEKNNELISRYNELVAEETKLLSVFKQLEPETIKSIEEVI